MPQLTALPLLKSSTLWELLKQVLEAKQKVRGLLLLLKKKTKTTQEALPLDKETRSYVSFPQNK